MERGGVPHPLIVRLDNVTKQTGYVKHKTFRRRSEASDSDGLIPPQSRNIAEKKKALPVIPIPVSAARLFPGVWKKSMKARPDFRKRKSLFTQPQGHTLS